MNFIPCTVTKLRDNICVKVLDEKIEIPLSKSLSNKLSSYKNKNILLGLRSENINEYVSRKDNFFEAKMDLVEPLGMDTMVYFKIGHCEACARLKSSVI